MLGDDVSVRVRVTCPIVPLVPTGPRGLRGCPVNGRRDENGNEGDH